MAATESDGFGPRGSAFHTGLDYPKAHGIGVAAAGRGCVSFAGWESGGYAPATWSYYACWQAAFERLLRAKGICTMADLERRVRELAARPAGHDHEHDHVHEPDLDAGRGHEPA